MSRFLWADLQMERLCQLMSKASVVGAMRDLPKATSESLEGMYSDLLSRAAEADPGSHIYAQIAFSWLLCMYEPLSPQAFLAAISTLGPDEHHKLTLSELLAICSNLIVLDSKSDTLRFVHLSFREYLEARPEFELSRINGVAAKSCLRTCGQVSPFQVRSPLEPSSHFALYAAMYWPRHYQVATVRDETGSFTENLKDFIFYEEGETSLPFMAWLETAQNASEILAHDNPLKRELNAVASSSMTPFFTACIYGLTDILQIVLALTTFDVDEKNFTGQTGIYLASASNHLETVELLLSHGADIAIEGGRHMTPFLAACSNGHVKIVELFLKQDSRFLLQASIEVGFRSSLSAGHELVALLLLRNGITIATQDDYVRVLDSAAQAGLFYVSDHLIQNFPVYAKANVSPSKLLDMAIRKGQPSFFRKYAQGRSIPSHTLALAALFGQLEIALLCLDSGLSIEENGLLGSPLRCACLMGHETVMRMLISRGANVNVSGPFGTALHAAAMCGHLSMVTHLINSKADVNGVGGYFGTALQSAAYRGHLDVARVLVHAGARVADGGRYKDALHAAAEGGHDDILKLFLDAGFQYPAIRDLCGKFRRLPPMAYKNLLREAFYARDISSTGPVTCLNANLEMSTGADILDFGDVFQSVRDMNNQKACDSQSKSMRQPRASETIHSEPRSSDILVSAVLKSDQRIVQVLVSHCRKLKLDPQSLGFAFETACRIGHIGIVTIFLRADFPFPILAAANAASHNGNMDVLRELIAYEKNRNKTGKPRGTYVFGILMNGCSGNHTPVVIYGWDLVDDENRELFRVMIQIQSAKSGSLELLKHFTDLTGGIRFEEIGEILKAAAAQGQTAVVHFLFNSHSSDGIQREHCQDALNGALSSGHSEVALYILQHSPPGYIVETPEDLICKGVRGLCYQFLSNLIPVVKRLSSGQILINQMLNEACANGDLKMARVFIQSGADVNAFVKVLSDSNKARGIHYQSPDPFSLGNQPCPALIQCIMAIPRTDNKRSITKREMDVRLELRDTALIKQEPIMKLLLESGATAGFAGELGIDIFNHVVLNASAVVVRAMISAGADIHASSPRTGTPLQCAASREIDALAIMKILIEAGAKYNVTRGENGTSCQELEAAVKFFDLDLSKSPHGRFIESTSIIQVLSEGPGAVINLILHSIPDLRAGDAKFRLLMQMAAAGGDTEYVRLLIERGADFQFSGQFRENMSFKVRTFGMEVSALHKTCAEEFKDIFCIIME